MSNYAGTDLISIIVPVYKVEKYLNQCVESIVNQSYENIEIILVDDGSPDNCGAICDEWARKDPRINVIHQENRGISGARNAGIDESNGQYLMFIDSDDYIAKEFVEKLYLSIKEYDADISLCGFQYLQDDSILEKVNVYDGEISCIDRIDALIALESSGNQKIAFTVVWNKIYRRELWDETRFLEGKICEDEFVMPILYERCEQVVVIADSLYTYRKRSGSITSKLDEKFMNVLLEFHKERETIYLRLEVKELLILQQIHIYSIYHYFEKYDVKILKDIQKKIRRYYFSYKYRKKVLLIRRAKNLIAVISLAAYQKIVNMKCMH